MVENTVHHLDEELARFYGVRIQRTGKDWVIREFKAVCLFTGRTIRVGTIEWVVYELTRYVIPFTEESK